MRPPRRSRASRSRRLTPARESSPAAARPATPPPMMITSVSKTNYWSQSAGSFFCQEILTGFRATTAGFGTDAAMFHPGAVFLALGPAAFARFDAGPELGASQLEIGPGKARDDSRR